MCALELIKIQTLRSVLIKVVGFSKQDFQKFENLATVAPSITLWSADQLTCIMWASLRFPSLSYRGTICNTKYKSLS